MLVDIAFFLFLMDTNSRQSLWIVICNTLQNVNCNVFVACQAFRFYYLKTICQSKSIYLDDIKSVCQQLEKTTNYKKHIWIILPGYVLHLIVKISPKTNFNTKSLKMLKKWPIWSTVLLVAYNILTQRINYQLIASFELKGTNTKI